jgi:hypothetical protein
MLGQPVAYDRVPYFCTDQYELGMEYSGYTEPGRYDEVIFVGKAALRDPQVPLVAGQPLTRAHLRRPQLRMLNKEPG